jgi:hypothetical protein
MLSGLAESLCISPHPLEGTPQLPFPSIVSAPTAPHASLHGADSLGDLRLQVIYGTDFLAAEAADRIDTVRRQVVSHMAAAPDALLVIEEYDKLDCAARGMWRQLLQHPEIANITSHR